MKPSWQRFRVNGVQFRLLWTLKRLGIVECRMEQEYVDTFGNRSYELDLKIK